MCVQSRRWVSLPELGSRNALIGASAFALLVVVLSILGAQPLELLFGVAMIVLPVIFLYLIIRRAVSGGVRDASDRSVENIFARPGRYWTSATRAVRSVGTSTNRYAGISKRGRRGPALRQSTIKRCILVVQKLLYAIGVGLYLLAL